MYPVGTVMLSSSICRRPLPPHNSNRNKFIEKRTKSHRLAHIHEEIVGSKSLFPKWKAVELFLCYNLYQFKTNLCWFVLKKNPCWPFEKHSMEKLPVCLCVDQALTEDQFAKQVLKFSDSIPSPNYPWLCVSNL